MPHKRGSKALAAKRRTTLTLPVESLAQAERIARAKNVNLSMVVAEALADGLQMHAASEHAEQVLSAYKKAFTGFSDEEGLLLDGVLLEPTGGRDR
jgi:post-segregation antitoxin (ccd killing protein)